VNLKKRVLAISGPTAVGKTELALRIAKELDGEIISCDSMQIYKGMDIGTAKPSAEELARVRHHMIDVVPPSVDFSCADYKAMATEALENVISRGKLPIFCGGTGLYLESVLYGGELSEAPADKEVRDRLMAEDPAKNWERLVSVDPEAAAKTHMNNRVRVTRALEIYELTGVTKTEWDRRSKMIDNPYDTRLAVLFCSDRERLYDRINKRVDLMIESGLEAEVRSLDGLMGRTASAAIGYKEMLEYINGACELTEAIERIKQASRNYAKRQDTWWRRNKNAHLIDVSSENFKNIVNFVISFAKND
jgi:tRNA dimethylallyltransferase